MKTYVVDMNMLQKQEFAQLIETDATSTFVIPDVAIVEMCKSENCELTMRRALKVFGPHTDRIEVAIGVSQVLRMEKATRKPVSRVAILSPAFASTVRQLITDLTDEEAKKAEEIQQTYASLRSTLLSQDLDASAAKALTAQGMKILGSLPKPFFSAIRKNGFPHSRFQDLVHVMTDILLKKKAVNELGMSNIGAAAFVRARPMTVRYEYLLVRHCMLTLKRGGDISGAKPEKELNHHLDMDYVALGSYFDGVLSHDNGVKDAAEDLQNFLFTPSDEAHTRIAPWFEELAKAK